MKTINKEVKANTKLAKQDNPFQPSTSGGGIGLSQKVSIGADAQSEYENLPRQIQLVLNYIFALGGVATMKEINTYSETTTGVEFWGRGDKAYEQSPSKITGHYSARVFGEVEYSKKLGIVEILKKVK
tara:strand:- start:21 stop:404 length:384 start_codon:yes stop_codon:yes gene_type:complete